MSSTVYQAILAVQKDLAATGISKDRRNAQQGYNFRGIDDVYNALAPVISKHGLCILPRILSRECTERQTKTGGALFYVVVEAEFDFVSAEDGSKHTIRTYGEAMDSADKATNKAMSAAYKYAAMQAFAIPTEGDNDADATTHDVAPRGKDEGRGRQQQGAGRSPTPSMEDRIAADLEAKIEKCDDVPALVRLWKDENFQASLKSLPSDGFNRITRAKDNRKNFLSQAPAREAAE